jgi:hypothetical protein
LLSLPSHTVPHKIPDILPLAVARRHVSRGGIPHRRRGHAPGIVLLFTADCKYSMPNALRTQA